MVLADSHRVPRVPWYLGGAPGSRHAFAYGAVTLYRRPFQIVRLAWRFLTPRPHRDRAERAPTTPTIQRSRAWHTAGFGCSPFARRYWGNRCCFLFLRVLRWFTSPRWLPSPYEFGGGWSDMTRTGLPHSEIPGSKPACGSPRLIAACYVLRRLPAPRHPPHALSSLTMITDRHSACSSYPLLDCQRASRGTWSLALHARPASRIHSGSLRPATAARGGLVEVSGFEPLASCLQSRRSPD